MFISNCRYCSTCHTEVSHESATPPYGWCLHCDDLVEVTSCKVPYWIVGGTLALLVAVVCVGLILPKFLPMAG